ncbi:MAG: hypothetical protein KC416_08995, partial [Myxococcales bacterium]|nr:hypothetical protein [Myxococcales bacterium]
TTDALGYLIDVGLPVPSRTMFDRDPAIKREIIWAGRVMRPAATLLDRTARGIRIADQEGRRHLELSLPPWASVLDELVDPIHRPELTAVRDTVRGWRFYDSFRVDPRAPARRPQVGTRTEVLAADGHDLALVGAAEAKRAILLAPRDAGHETDAITIANLGALRSVNTHAHAFVEVVDSANNDIVEAVGGEGTFPLDMPRFVGLLLSHHLVTPGIEKVYEDLLSARGSEFYTHVFVDSDENDALAKLEGSRIEMPVEYLCRAAYEHHGVILTGFLLAHERLSRKREQLIPVERLTAWLNPFDPVSAERTGLAVTPKVVPIDTIRGVFGIAQTFGPMRDLGHRLLTGGVIDTPPPRAVNDAVLNFAKGLSFDRTPVRRVLVVGYSPALGSLMDALARFVHGIEVIAVVGARNDARTSLRQRLESLGAGGTGSFDGTPISLPHGGRARIYTHEGPGLADFAVATLKDQPPIDAVTFLADPDSVDRDARTLLRALRFAKALEGGLVPRAKSLHVLVEFESVEKGQPLRARFSPKRCGFPANANLRVTLLSTDQIRSYFMVHSAFVPGVTSIYEAILGDHPQDLVRLEPRIDAVGEPSAMLVFGQLLQALRPMNLIAVAIEDREGAVHLNPPKDRTFRLGDIAAVFAIANLETWNHSPAPGH